MSTRVEAIKPPNKKWEAMKAVYDACVAAGTSTPKEVDDFFNGGSPDTIGVIAATVHDSTKLLPPWVTKVEREMESGFEIDVTKLPKDVTVVRFTNSY